MCLLLSSKIFVPNIGVLSSITTKMKKNLIFLMAFLCLSLFSKAQESLVGMPQDVVINYLKKDDKLRLSDISPPYNGYIVVSYYISNGDELLFVFNDSLCKSYTYCGKIENLQTYIAAISKNYNKIDEKNWIDKNKQYD